MRSPIGLAVILAVLLGSMDAEAGMILLPVVDENSTFITPGVVPFSLTKYSSGIVPVCVGPQFNLESAIQFNLSSLQGFSVTSATLTLAATQFGTGGGTGTSSFDVSVSGYSGTGTVGLGDFEASALFTGGSFAQSATYVNSLPISHLLTPITENVTSLVQSEVSQGDEFAGFLLDPTNVMVTIPNQFQVDFNDAELIVQFTAVPTPTSLLLLGIGTLSIVGYAHRHRRSGAQVESRVPAPPSTSAL